MTEKTQPTNAELDMLIDDVAGLDSSNETFRKFARAVLARWGPTQARAVPLTPEQVVDAFCKQPHTVQFVEAFIKGVRFAERHHGIKGGQHGTH